MVLHRWLLDPKKIGNAPRDKISYESTQIKGLYPCGEGAGYAGGIVSAAIDGINCMKKIIEKNDFN